MGEQKTNPNGRGYAGDADAAEGPPHEVTLSSHWIDRYPVTVQKYRRFVEAGSEGYRAERFWTAEAWAWLIRGKREAPGNWEDQVAHPNRPVVYVSWYEALAYCAWQSERHAGWRVGLPTEAQWEFAARGPEGRKYPWGSTEPSDRHANFDGRVGEATPVGIYPLGATTAGVHDLAGNVWEWCADLFGRYQAARVSDFAGQRGAANGVLRGGAFNLNSRDLRSASRYYFDRRHGRSPDVGFRCVWLWQGGQR
jgi:formylglycine-generating enzyme required for sulfatase activity